MSTMITRQIVLDTETTGMNKLGIHYEGHNIIEIGIVEVINRRLTGRNFHVYIKPARLVDPEAFRVHGISDEFLQDKPTFAEIADEFLDFIRGAELVIHNAPFDIGFMDYEFSKLNRYIPPTANFCQITDSLVLARKLFPGKRNNLDALCNRYHVDNSKRTLHSALFDAQILAEVYMAMTVGQTSLAFSVASEPGNEVYTDDIKRIDRKAIGLTVIYANQEEILAHEENLDLIDKKSGKISIWRSPT
ncbi:DNA polymerase III subunit epsilon [Arsenophonus endosymbiont of Aleurodicus dispersus]|uniref:DNA polymerase III subunit epsilon n=1 Tax=Arsenophonus endosymbiont of Aleurodicus dispersus TaxID=235559 RepID=UPI000EB0FBA6|nr:DNA polymerase III subunit epsilon [Arsenophonus endosymbiont of Aleurodicus dispersus]VAY02231.1 DNA polymerase III subunit epsilon [Arsenophonus endosymbiont of Aleurodicus dispersus]